MKWPPDKSKPAWSPQGGKYAIQSIGGETVSLVHEASGFPTTVGRVEFTENWSQKGPEMKPIHEQVWTYNEENGTVDDENGVPVEFHVEAHGLAAASAPNMVRALAEIRDALRSGTLDSEGAEEVCTRALKQAGAL